MKQKEDKKEKNKMIYLNGKEERNKKYNEVE